MHVEGAVEQSKYDPHEIAGLRGDGRSRNGPRPQGNVPRPDHEGQLASCGCDGVYNVRAEVANRQEHGNWLLRDGLPATMTIHLGTGGTAAAGVSRAP